MDLSVGPLAESEWAASRGLAHRAFVDEPFTVEMFGEQILDRWGGSWGLYSSLGTATSTLAFGARVDEVLVGVVLGSATGQCSMCQVYAHESRPDDPHLAIDWQFHQNIAEVHRSLDEHAWIDKLAVEPALHGLGIGRRLLVAVAEALQGGEPTEARPRVRPRPGRLLRRCRIPAGQHLRRSRRPRCIPDAQADPLTATGKRRRPCLRDATRRRIVTERAPGRRRAGRRRARSGRRSRARRCSCARTAPVRRARRACSTPSGCAP